MREPPVIPQPQPQWRGESVGELLLWLAKFAALYLVVVVALCAAWPV